MKCDVEDCEEDGTVYFTGFDGLNLCEKHSKEFLKLLNEKISKK